jgi:major membrane immunogen (membrane-anchored lipoprotein)
MRMTRRFIALLTLLVLLSACGEEDKSTPSTSATDPTPTTGTDSISLSWLPPTTRADGTPLAAHELAGYRIYMGTSRTVLRPVADLDDENISKYTVNDLESGEYFFAISAFDTDGAESAMSGIVALSTG